MPDQVHLYGYRYSVYTRIVRMVLIAKAVPHETVEVNPFEKLSDAYLSQHPFGRVPMITHGNFQLFETSAIVRYVDRTFAGPSLQPATDPSLARMEQVISVIDSYAYWPMVRQVSSHAFFRPFFGEPASQEEIDQGLETAKISLSFFDRVAEEGQVLTGQSVTLADLYLAPMMDYFVRAEVGKLALSQYQALQKWWSWISALDVIRATDPFQ